MRRFSSVRPPPLPCGLADRGDRFLRLSGRWEVSRGGGGPRLGPGPLAVLGVSLTMGEYWEMDEAPL
jgi:hypothetical protein